VRDGRYDSGAKAIVDAIRREAKSADDDGALTDAVRSATFGPDHPYTRAGLVRHVSPTLTIDDVKAFRAAHYTPGNATLVITGHVDAVLVERWVDFLFGDWEGRAPRRAGGRAALQPASIAVVSDAEIAAVTVVLPATAGGRAEQLIAAQMLDDLAADIRHQLGAAYGVGAILDEDRLAASYEIDALIDAPRLGEAVALLQTRIGELRTNPEDAARAFVTARKRVAHRLQSRTTSAAALADRAEQDLALGRDPTAGERHARDVRAVTIDRMGPVLAELDLAAAAVVIAGRAADVDGAFAALGRTPTRVEAQAKPSAAASPTTAFDDDDEDDEHIYLDDLTDPLTRQPRPLDIDVVVTPGYAIAPYLGDRVDADVSGYQLAAGVLYQATPDLAVGVRGAIGALEGTYEVDRLFAVMPVSFGAYAITSLGSRVYAGGFVSAHFAKITDDRRAPRWDKGVGFGLELGAELVRVSGNAFGLFGRLETPGTGEDIVPILSFGLLYRH
jgi:hypothetical protein